MQNVFPLSSKSEIRTALRKRTVQTAIYKKQAESGRRCFEELFAYIGFMSDKECQEFLNSVREAPFIPGVNLMWTDQIAEYLMLDSYEVLRRSYGLKNMTVEGCIEAECPGRVYGTSYMKNHVPETSWGLLPRGWSAKYFTPQQVLRLAIRFENSSQICKHIGEKLFIKATDLEDCLTPVTEIPPALPVLPREVRLNRKNKIVMKDLAPGTKVEVSVSNKGEPEVIQKKPARKVSIMRNNPRAAAIAPVCAADVNLGSTRNRQRSTQINASIAERYHSLDGTERAAKIAADLGISVASVYDRAYRIKKARAAAVE